MIDRDVLTKLLTNNLDAKLNDVLVAHGYELDSLHNLFHFITRIFERIPPELIKWKFRVVMPIGSWDFSKMTILDFNNLGDRFTSECTFVVIDSNIYAIESYEVDCSASDYICYNYYAPRNETLSIKETLFQLSDYCESTASSIFYQPIYRELDEAIDFYNKRYAYSSSCEILSLVWTNNAKREFVQKPEHYMRDSLWQCLQNILRNHTVKREQNVDETHPVDIKVIWPTISNVALIEVKWLGDSEKIHYRDARANEGAKQLIDYLASSHIEEPDKHFEGYLTVFDGRRGRRKNQYVDKDVNYHSEYYSHPNMNYKRFYMAE